MIYTRWEYTDKEQKRLQSLWTMNPDGTGVYAPFPVLDDSNYPGKDIILIYSHE